MPIVDSAVAPLSNFVDSVAVKALAFCISCIVMPLLLYQIHTTNEEIRNTNDRMSRVEAYLANAQADKREFELRLKTLELLVPERTAALKALYDKTLNLEFRVDELMRSHK